MHNKEAGILNYYILIILTQGSISDPEKAIRYVD
jgi:hypothetical protein